MSPNGIEPSLRQRPPVADAVLAHVAWRDECTEVWSAYTGWVSAPATDMRRAHAAYQAALDREETAAKIYAKLTASDHDLVGTGSDYPHVLRGRK